MRPGAPESSQLLILMLCTKSALSCEETPRLQALKIFQTSGRRQPKRIVRKNPSGFRNAPEHANNHSNPSQIGQFRKKVPNFAGVNSHF
jgi:hypothetical protein